MSLENILSQEIVQKLGWTLLHFVWQATAVTSLLAIVLAALRKSTANLRYIIACLALGLMVLLPMVTMALVPASRPQPITSIEPPPAPVVVPVRPTTETMPSAGVVEYEEPVRPERTETAPMISWRQRAAAMLEPALPYIVIGWFLGVFGLSVWHLGGWAHLQRLRKRMVRKVDASLHATLGQLADKLGVGRAVELLESALVQVPTVVGWLRPVILLPASALTGLTTEQLEALLAHELAHVRRCDYVVNMLQTIVETLGFYHPAVWWVSHKIRVERENCCDDLAVGICGDRLRYARALTSMEEIRSGRGELAVAASGGNLSGRIRRLVSKDSADDSRTSWIPSVITILLIAVVAIPTTLALTGQSSDKSKTDIETLLLNGFCENRDKFKCGVLAWTRTTKNDGFPERPNLLQGSFQLWWSGKKMTTRYVDDQVVRTPESGPYRVEKRSGGNIYDGSFLSRKPRYKPDENWFDVIHWAGPTAIDQEMPALMKRRNIEMDFSSVAVEGRDLLKLLTRNIDKTTVDYRAYTVSYFDPSRSYSLVNEEWYTEDDRLRLRFTYKLQEVIPNGWFPVEVDLKGYSLIDGKVYMERRLALDLERCSFNDPSAIPEGIFDLSASKEHERLNDIMEKLSKGVVADESDNSGKGPLESVRSFIASALLGDDEKAAALIDRKRNGYEQAKTMREVLHGQDISLVGLCLSEWNAMTISSVIQADHGRVGPLVFLLKKVVLDQEVHWLIDDIDIETLDTIEQEIKRFIERNPDAKASTIKPRVPVSNPAPADDNIESPSAQFISDKMLEHHSRVKNLQYVTEAIGGDGTDEFIKHMEDQIKKRREEGASERDIGFSERSLERIKGWRKDHESRYETITCTIDNEGRSKIELTRGDYDASGKKMPADYKLIRAWNGIQSIKFYQNKYSGSLTATIKDVPSGSMHPWRLFISDLCQSLKETVEAKKDVSVERLKDGTYRIAFDDTTKRRIAAVIDPSRGYTCALREDYDDQGKCASRYTATYEEVAEGIWFPVSGELETFSGGSTDYRRSFKSSDIRINGPAFNPGYFDVDMPEGTEVTDEVQGKQYIVGSKRVHDLDKPQKTSTETQEVDPNAWQEKFYSIYRLDDGQVLKRITPPFIPERREYFKLAQPGRYSANTPYQLAKQFIFSWDGDLNIRNMPMGGGIPRLRTILESAIGLGRNEYDIPPEVLSMDMSGDWIMRKDIPQEELLQALEQIIKEETGKDIHFVKQKAEAKVIVARGTYRLTPLPDAKEKDCVHVFTDKMDTYQGAGGGRGTVGRFLRWVGDHRINTMILAQTESADVELSWRNHYSSDLSGLEPYKQQHNEKVEMLLSNLARQMGLIFERGTTAVERWFVAEAGIIQTTQQPDPTAEHEPAEWQKQADTGAGSNDAMFENEMGQIDEARLGTVRKAKYTTLDPKTRRPEREFGFQKLLHKGGDLWEIEKPYMNVYRRNSTCYITADKGEIEVETTAGKTTPQDVTFSSNVVVRIVADGGVQESFLYLDNIVFLSDQSLLTTTGPVRFVSGDAQMRGTGLELIYNDQTERFEYFGIADLERLRIKGTQATAISTGTDRPEPNAATVAGEGRAHVRVELSVAEISSDSKVDAKTTGEIKNLLGGRITLPDSPAAADLLRKASEATAPVKDGSASDKRVTREQFNRLFDLLASRGYLKILLRPTLEVIEGQTAQIKTDQNSLEVTVQAVKDDAIDMQLEANLGSRLAPDGNDQTPMFSKRSFSSRMRISSGQSLIIGGLMQPESPTAPASDAERSQSPAKELLCILTASITTPPADVKPQDQAAARNKKLTAQLDAASNSLETTRDDFEVFKPRIIKLANCDPAQMAALLTALFAEEGGEQENIRDAILGEDAQEKYNIVGPLSDHFKFEEVPETDRIIVISNIPKAYEAVVQLILELDKQKMAAKDVKQVREWMARLAREGRPRAPKTTDELEQSADRLKRLGLAIAMYANEHDNKLPDRLQELEPYIGNERNFLWATNNVDYLGRGKTREAAKGASTPVAYDKSMLKEGKGTNVLFNDSHVEFVKPEKSKELGVGGEPILIDAKILTVGEEFMKYIGLNPNLPASSEGWADYLVHSTGDSASFVIDHLHADLLLKAAMAHKDSRALTAPRVMAMNGKKIEMWVQDSGGALFTTPAEPSQPSGEPAPESNYTELGTTVRLTPNLMPDGKTVDLDFEWEYRRLRGVKEHTGPDGNVQKVPQIDVDRIKTSCSVPDGKTLLIAGKKITVQKKKKPRKLGLADIPLIGRLFSSQPKAEETKNFLILVKPVVDPPGISQAQRETEPPPLDPDDPLIKQLKRRFERAAQ